MTYIIKKLTLIVAKALPFFLPTVATLTLVTKGTGAVDKKNQEYILEFFINKKTKQVTTTTLFIFNLLLYMLFKELSLIFNIYISFIIIFIISFVSLMYFMSNNNFSTNFLIRLIQKVTIISLSIYTIFSLIINVFLIIKSMIENFIKDTIPLQIINFDKSKNILSPMDKSIKEDTVTSATTQVNDVLNIPKDDVIVTSTEVLKTIESVGKSIGDGIKSLGESGVADMVTNIGGPIGMKYGASKVASKALEGMSGRSPANKVLVAGATSAAFVGAVGGTMLINKALEKKIMGSMDANNNKVLVADATNQNTTDITDASGTLAGGERSSSPNIDFIASILEPSEITTSLEDLLNIQILFNSLILLCLFITTYSLFLLFISKYNINLLSYILGDKLSNKFINKDQILKFNAKFYSIIIIINILLISYLILMNIFISIELKTNLNDYITTHKSIRDSMVCFIGFTPVINLTSTTKNITSNQRFTISITGNHARLLKKVTTLSTMATVKNNFNHYHYHYHYYQGISYINGYFDRKNNLMIFYNYQRLHFYITFSNKDIH
jgi:hypothetical protein